MNGSVTAAQVLIEHGADLHIRDARGATPMDLAVAHNQSAMVALLREHGVPIDAARVAIAAIP